MATLFTHAYVGGQFPRQIKEHKKLILLCAIGAVVPDIDILSFKLGIPYTHLFGHRGFTHSLFFAFLWGGIVSFLLTKRFSLKEFILLSLSCFSHSILDMLTNGGAGVALFAPFSNHRYFLPIAPIQVSPIGIKGFFSKYGLLAIITELVWIVFPLEIVFKFRNKKQLIALVGGFVTASIAWSILWPMPTVIRPKKDILYKHSLIVSNSANDINAWPQDLFPANKIIRNVSLIEKYSLSNKWVSVEKDYTPWSHSFFPTLYGGIAGRWQDSKWKLLLRSLMGQKLMTAKEAKNVLINNQDFVNKLSPMEKYDLAIGDYHFNGTRYESEVKGHNLSLPYPTWSGYCNGLALSTIMFKAPRYPVDVRSTDGYNLKFYPTDVVALLSRVGMEPYTIYNLGNRCHHSYDTTLLPECRDVNPGSFIISHINVIGRLGLPLFIDDDPLHRVQNYPIYSYKIDFGKIKSYNHPDIAQTVLTEVTIKIAATDIDYFDDPTQYPVLKTLERKYKMELALDQVGEIIGGKWLSDHPDFIQMMHPRELKLPQRLARNQHLYFPFINLLWQKSLIPNSLLNWHGQKLPAPKENKQPLGEVASLCRSGQTQFCNTLGQARLMAGDKVSAEKLWKKSCRLNSGMGCYLLSKFYRTEKEKENSTKYLEISCQKGLPMGCLDYGRQMGDEGRDEKSKEAFNHACAEKNAWGCYELALLYKKQGLLKFSKKYFKKACDQNHSASCIELVK